MSLKCPACKDGEIEVRDKNFFCSNYVKDGDICECNFILWRSDLERFGRSKLSEDEAIKLIRGEEIALKALTSKAGKKFDCKGRLAEIDTESGNKKWAVQFVFEDRPRRLLGGE